MTAALKSWWHARAMRERLLLAGTGVLALLIFGWLLLLRPQAAALDRAHDRLDGTVARLAEVRAAVRRIRAAGRATASATQPVDAVVGQSAVAAGLTVARIETSADGVTLAIDAVRPPALFGWLAGLEQETGIGVRRFSAQRNEDSTISVQMLLGRGG